MIYDKKVCKQFLKNKTINPKTGRKIQKGKKTYNDLMNSCIFHKLLKNPSKENIYSTSYVSPLPVEATVCNESLSYEAIQIIDLYLREMVEINERFKKLNWGLEPLDFDFSKKDELVIYAKMKKLYDAVNKYGTKAPKDFYGYLNESGNFTDWFLTERELQWRTPLILFDKEGGSAKVKILIPKDTKFICMENKILVLPGILRLIDRIQSPSGSWKYFSHITLAAFPKCDENYNSFPPDYKKVLYKFFRSNDNTYDKIALFTGIDKYGLITEQNMVVYYDEGTSIDHERFKTEPIGTEHQVDEFFASPMPIPGIFETPIFIPKGTRFICTANLNFEPYVLFMPGKIRKIKSPENKNGIWIYIKNFKS